MLWPKSLLFLFDPEFIHEHSLEFLHQAPWIVFPWNKGNQSSLNLSVKNMNWATPFGIAAGLDKNAMALHAFNSIGAGALEIGTVTVLPQAGNPRPRLFRYPDDSSLRNSMGFPNEGSQKILARLQNRPEEFCVGTNIGKSKLSTNQEAITEYAKLYETFAPNSDYLVVNISSPNTPGLRDLQDEKWLLDLDQALKPLLDKFQKPLWLKISPDLSDSQLNELLRFLPKLHFSGIVATNTTMRPDLGTGGVSGKWLAEKSQFVRTKSLERLKDTPMEVIGVGGISDFRDILHFWERGGKLIQVYTSLIFKGPHLLRELELATLSLLHFAHLPTLKMFFSLPLRERQHIIHEYKKYAGI